MSKKLYRYFGGLLQLQQNWLNKMAKKGYRLTAVDKLLYEFEECAPNSVEYRMEFIGSNSQEKANDYFDFLKEMGYKVFFKNINLNYSVGKVRYRPWAEKGGRIAANRTTFNKELLIVEKETDGKPFELHTSFEDKILYYERLCKPYVTFIVLFLFLGIFGRSVLLGLCALLSLLPVILYQRQIGKLKKAAQIEEG